MILDSTKKKKKDAWKFYFNLMGIKNQVIWIPFGQRLIKIEVMNIDARDLLSNEANSPCMLWYLVQSSVTHQGTSPWYGNFLFFSPYL